MEFKVGDEVRVKRNADTGYAGEAGRVLQAYRNTVMVRMTGGQGVMPFDPDELEKI